MDILSLILLYYLSQKDDFFESIKPIVGNIKSSENLLKFLNDLNRFSEIFSAFKNTGNEKTGDTEQTNQPKKAENSAPSQNEKQQSPTAGIANEFIQKSLDAYFKKRS